MSLFKAIIYPFPIMMYVVFMLASTNYSKQINEVIKERELAVVCNYAADAAVQEMVEASNDLNMDYIDFEYANVDPSKALDAYISLYLRSYNMSESDTNKAVVRTEYIPMFCVAAYDGYYVAVPNEVYRETYGDLDYGMTADLKFTPKIPYTYKKGKEVYSLNLGADRCTIFNSESGTLERDAKVGTTISVEENFYQINAQVSDAMMEAAYKAKAGAMKGAILVPAAMGNIYRTTPIKNISVLAYMSDVPAGWSTLKLDNFSIGGAQVKHTRYIGAYERYGKPYYQYLDNLVGKIDGSDIITYYETIEEAARDGYYYDFEYDK